MNKQFLNKYCASSQEIDFVSQYLYSYSKTFSERYNNIQLDGLHVANAPIFFDSINQLIRKTGLGTQENEEFNFVYNMFVANITNINKNIKEIFPGHIKIKLGEKDNNFLTTFSLFKKNSSFFLVEHRLVLSINILQHFHSEKSEQKIQQQNLLELLKNLIIDFA